MYLKKSIDKESYTGRRIRNAGQIYHHDKKNYQMAGSVKDNGKLKSGQTYPNRNKRCVWTIPTQGYSEAHFATYPIALIYPCIKAGCHSGGIVLDPFMGSGTTAIVAERLNRRWIGIEINQEYCDIAVDRIKKETAQYKMDFTQGGNK